MNLFRAMFVAVLATTLNPANAAPLLDQYNQILQKPTLSALDQLLLALLLDDCNSMSEVRDWEAFDEMVERTRGRGYDFFAKWEVEARNKFTRCHSLIISFQNEETYQTARATWLEKSVDSGSATARLLHQEHVEMQWHLQRFTKQPPDDKVVYEELSRSDLVKLIRMSLIEAYTHGDARLKHAALGRVHSKFRHDESLAIGLSALVTPSPQQEHELQALRNNTDELPWTYLSCKYQVDCTKGMFEDHLSAWYGKAEIESFIAIAEFYETCMEAKDWVSLDLDE